MNHPLSRGLPERLLALCEIDATTGREDAILPALKELLASAGAELREQPVAPGRTNLLARWSARPRVLFSTHLDTVPPHLPAAIQDGRVRGRGACDAKGQIVAQLAAIGRLLAAGERDLAWLGVVDEERGSTGAKKAVELGGELPALRAVINGEPTGNRLATGQRGILSLRLSCRGVAAHSGTPEKGRSAAWPLLDWLQALRRERRPVDERLGPEIWNLGLLRGGEAPNVVPAAAEAVIMARTVPGSDFLECVRRHAPEHADVEVQAETPPERFPPIEGFPTALVPFGSDAPRLAALAKDRTVVLVGPGSIEVAHTDGEYLELRELDAGVDRIEALARRFLEERTS